MTAAHVCLFIVAASAIAPAVADAQSFTLLSQNVLRFGHGRRLQQQCNAITQAALVADIIVMQEVMAPGYPCLAGNNKKGVNTPAPPGFTYLTSNAKGKSSYKEYYAILYRAHGASADIIDVAAVNIAVNQNAFMRPPYAVRFQIRDRTTNKACFVWIVDFHAVFGDTIKGRRDEAAAMQAVYTWLQAGTTDAVIIAGDWNLSSVDGAFGWLAGNQAAIQPTPELLTSLTKNGSPSSPYDHVVHTNNAPGPVTVGVVQQPGIGWLYCDPNNVACTPIGAAAWRMNVSDHVGVMANVTLTCP